MSMNEMPSVEAGHVYQAWGIWKGKDPVSLGVIPDEHTVAISVDLKGAAMFAVTEEPAGGSDQPTTAPMAVAQLD
jgi:anti-sigma-K factor RskA